MSGTKVRVEDVASTNAGEPEGHVVGLLPTCATETCVREESDALKVLLACVETRFREEHAALVVTTKG